MNFHYYWKIGFFDEKEGGTNPWPLVSAPNHATIEIQRRFVIRKLITIQERSGKLMIGGNKQLAIHVMEWQLSKYNHGFFTLISCVSWSWEKYQRYFIFFVFIVKEFWYIPHNKLSLILLQQIQFIIKTELIRILSGNYRDKYNIIPTTTKR